MEEYSPRQVLLRDPFWVDRQQVNARTAIDHQWQQLERSHCIDNFRLAAGLKPGFREGWFFADSDAYKWLEAACNVQALWPSSVLKQRIDEFITLLAATQAQDGYLFTYNQTHFPDQPHWQNLLIEHELYCHGHLIEAGIAHHQATGENSLLELACRAADLLVAQFLLTDSEKTSGHEEVEIALLRLYQETGRGTYFELARKFLENRGGFQPFALLILPQNARVNRRGQVVRQLQKDYIEDHPEYKNFQLPSDNYAKSNKILKVRWLLSALTGKFFQMQGPVRKQTVPVGHAVRFTYLETALAKLNRLDQDPARLAVQQKAWERMVTRRMYVTGGLGALPELEGFGRDYELDPEGAYAETCAALGSLFWNWEMTLNTGEARYADLFEWQLYNAASAGMGLNGDAYLYNNPLASRGGVTRQPWFLVPCCPSNLSRTWASLGKYLFSTQGNDVWLHQYIGCQADLNPGVPLRVEMQSGFPWDGRVHIKLKPSQPSEWTLWLRIPSWVEHCTLRVNGEQQVLPPAPASPKTKPTASGLDPRRAWYLPLQRSWQDGDHVELDFPMPILLRQASPRVRSCSGRSALTRGPLVYCLESKDNPGLELFSTRLGFSSLRYEFSPALLGGTGVITSQVDGGRPLTFIPYFLWANRGESQMNVWVRR